MKINTPSEDIHQDIKLNTAPSTQKKALWVSVRSFVSRVVAALSNALKDPDIIWASLASAKVTIAKIQETNDEETRKQLLHTLFDCYENILNDSRNTFLSHGTKRIMKPDIERYMTQEKILEGVDKLLDIYEQDNTSDAIDLWVFCEKQHLHIADIEKIFQASKKKQPIENKQSPEDNHYSNN